MHQSTDFSAHSCSVSGDGAGDAIPDPKRGEKTWDEFLKVHAATLWQMRPTGVFAHPLGCCQHNETPQYLITGRAFPFFKRSGPRFALHTGKHGLRYFMNLRRAR